MIFSVAIYVAQGHVKFGWAIQWEYIVLIMIIEYNLDYSS